MMAQDLFSIGDHVQRSAEAKRRFGDTKWREGVIVGFTSDTGCIRVKSPHAKHPQSWHIDFWEHADVIQFGSLAKDLT